jgi:hypothetical protein
MPVASSSANENLRVACDLTFHNVLARKAIVKGKRNLELLQGLLIYLAWHHHYSRHETQQIYPYLQLAIGMVVDLGLNKPQSKRRSASSLSHTGLNPERTSAEAEGATAEEERALLGCYSLSCGLAVLGFDKPQNLAYNEHLRRCSQNLAEYGCYDTDRDWLPTIELLHIAEEMQGSSGSNAETGSSELQARIRDAEQQQQNWEYYNLTRTRDHTRLSLTFHFVQIYLYQKAVSEEWSSQSHLVHPTQNISRLTSGAPMLLLSTLRATQAFLDDILIKLASLLRNMNIVEWTQLITAAITLASWPDYGLKRPVKWASNICRSRRKLVCIS